jgi:HlyD family secretion protein
MLQIIKRHKIITGIVIIAILGGGYFYFRGGKQAGYTTTTVVRSTLIQEVSVTGNVAPVKSAALAFEKGGKIQGIYTDVGARVTAGQILAETDNADLYAGVLDAQANLAAEEANLAALQRGTRPEQIDVSKTKVENAQTSLANATQALSDKISDAYTKSDDAVRNLADQLFSNPRSNNPQFNFTISDSQLKINIEQERYQIEQSLINWQKDIANMGTQKDFSSSTALAKRSLGEIKIFIDNMALAVNSLTAGGSLTQATIDTYKADISTARANINTAITNLSTADQGLRDAQSALTLAQSNLALDEAGSTPEQIATQQARVDQARAKVKTAQAQLDKTILRSPIAGIVTKKDAKVGEIVAANEEVISVITDQNLEIDANIPETDIAKVTLGDRASITLDAYGEDVIFQATVVSIDPAATVIEGVPTYKTTLYFAKYDPRIKSGMTANIDILTDKRENVLSVPTRAITTDGDVKTVKVLQSDNTIKKITIETGLRSSDGKTEVISGLKEGDRVITSNL